MVLTASDDPIYRPVGASGGKRRLFSFRHIVLVLIVLVVGGGGGTAAFFLSDMDMRDIIGFLDIADPGGPKLTMLMPGVAEDNAAKTEAPPEAKDLLTPPGGPVQRPEPAAIEVPPPLPIAMADHTPVAEPAKDDHAAVVPSPVVKGFDPKLFAGLVVPPPNVTAQPVPPPSPRPADSIPTLVGLSDRKGELPLPPVPDKALLGNSAHGPVPVVSADGRQPWKVYARPFDGPKDQPKIAVIVTDLGLDLTSTETVLAKLPPAVTVALSPYALELSRWIKAARDSGHEVLIILPVAVDTPGAPDPGPLGLGATLPEKENIARLEIILNRAPGVIGVLVPQTSFLSQGNGAPILAALLQRGLLYVGAPVTGLRNPPMATVNDVIDRSPWRAAIEARLVLALNNSKSIAGQVLVATPKPVTLQTLVPWVDSLSNYGITPAPVSAVALPPG
jgi:hypothetical protein